MSSHQYMCRDYSLHDPGERVCPGGGRIRTRLHTLQQYWNPTTPMEPSRRSVRHRSVTGGTRGRCRPPTVGDFPLVVPPERTGIWSLVGDIDVSYTQGCLGHQNEKGISSTCEPKLRLNQTDSS